MKVKVFGVETEKSGVSLFGIGATRGGLPELEADINDFIKNKKLVDIKLVTTTSNYQNNLHTMVCAMILYDEVEEQKQ